MTMISIIFSSETNHTRRMAEAVLGGCRKEEGVVSELFEILDKDFYGSRWSNDAILSTLDQSDAIIMGSPTYMGTVSTKIKAFMEATVSRYVTAAWDEKLAAGFTVSGGQAGDKFNTLSTMATFAMQQNMIWVGLGCNKFNQAASINEDGHYYGATGVAQPDDDPHVKPDQVELDSGRFLGERVARISLRHKLNKKISREVGE